MEAIMKTLSSLSLTSTIVCATENFAINKKIGEGGFGSVYMVSLWCTKAIKMMKHSFILFCSQNFSNLRMRISGYTRRWTRNCCQKAFKEFWTRIEWIQKWRQTNFQASTPKSCKTSWLLHSTRRETAGLWIHAQQRPRLLHFWFGSLNLIHSASWCNYVINIS